MSSFLNRLLAGTVLAIAAGSAPSNAAIIDTVEAPTGFFVPTDAQKNDAPYYRGATQDWEWQHSAIASAFTTATLNISAFDVDFASGELDNIYADDDGVWVLLGALTGTNQTWQFGNEFVLGAQFYDDIVTGLKVRIDIDVGEDGWFVTLGKSSLSLDGAVLPPPTPGIPEPASWAMLITGFGLVGAAARRRRTVAVAA